MKKKTHPEYKEVLFVDSSTGQKFVCGSTLKTKETEMFEGKEYAVCRVSVSSFSHPFFTGNKQFVDAEGRVDKFRKRYNAGSQTNAAAPKKEEPVKQEAPKQAAPAKKIEKAKAPKVEKAAEKAPKAAKKQKS